MNPRTVGLLVAAVFAVAPLVAGEKENCPHPVEDCLESIRSTMKNSGWVGVVLDFDEVAGGWALTEIVADSPAEVVGLRKGDILFAANGVRADGEQSEEMWQAHRKTKAGDAVVWEIRRDGKEKKIEIVLAPMPADLLAKYIGEHLALHAGADQPPDGEEP